MLTLVALLACSNPKPPPASEPPVEPANPCMEACLQDSMAVAMAWEAIEASCRASCEARQVVRSSADLALRSGQQVQAHGSLQRVDLPDGEGTALVLDDETALVISQGAPPRGWEGLVGQRIRVLCTLWEGPPPDSTGPPLPHLSDCAGPLPENVHPL